MNLRFPAASFNAIVGDLPPQAAATFAVRIVAFAAEFACLLLMARVFGAKAYGSYAIAMSVVAVAVVPAIFGLDRFLIREVAAAQAAGNWLALSALIGRAGRIVLLASLVVSLILVAAVTQTELLPIAVRGPLSLAVWLVPIVAGIRIQQAILQGLGHVPAGLIPESVLQPILLAVLVLLLAATGWGTRSPEAAVTLQLGTAVAALAAAAFLLKHRLPSQIVSPSSGGPAKPLLASGATFMWLTSMSAALVNVDTLLTGMQLGPAQAGAYRAASQIAMFVGFPLAAVSMATAPSMSALHATGRHDELRALTRKAARVIVAACAAIASVVVLFGQPLLAALGPGFEAGYPATLVLVAAYLFHASMATSTYILFMTAHERLAATVFTAGVIVHVAANLVLVPRLGLVGAALAAGGGLMLVSAACAIAAWRTLAIDATILSGLRREPRP